MKIICDENKWLRYILIASVVFRIATSFYLGDKVVDLPGTFDQISYHNLAIRVLTGHGFSFSETWWPITPPGAPTAHWSFLYTLYLVSVYFIFGVHPLAARLFQAVVTGLLQPYLAYQIGNKLFSKSVGLVSAGLTAIYAYFIYYDATLMTEPFFITLLMASLYISILIAQNSGEENTKTSIWKLIKLPVFLGLVVGGAVLLRQLILLLIPIIFLWIWWTKRKQNFRFTLMNYLISGGIIVLMILPFTIYNTNRFGHFVLLNTNSGFAFFWSNHPTYGTQFVPLLGNGIYQNLIPVELRNMDEANLDQTLLRRGIQFVIDDPIRIVLLSISRIPVYFMFWPTKDSGFINNVSRVASFGLLWPFMLYGLIRSIADQKISLADRIASPSFLLIIFMIIYSLIHLLSWALIRYRLPIDAILIVFAGLAMVDLAQRIMTCRNPSI